MVYYVFILFSFTVYTVSAFSRERIRPEYDFKDSSFSLTYSFDIPKIPESEILNILFNFEKVREYSTKTNIKVTLVEENERTNRILYEYNYLVAKLELQMFREKIKEQKTVVFRMEKYKRSAKIIPDVLLAGGSYKIVDNSILYKQQTVMNRKINATYTMLIKRDVQKYLKEIMEYIDEQSKKYN
jgi:hypothetical protein